MSKLIVLLMDQTYPFLCNRQQAPTTTTTIIVRQTLQTSASTKHLILSKANFIKNLKNKYLVKVDSILEEQEAVHIQYQYIQSKFENVFGQCSILLVNKIYAQLSEFGRYLSNIGVRTLFSIDKIGIGAGENFKYFMGLDFQWQDDPDECFLQQFYQKQIEDIMGQHLATKYIPNNIPRKDSFFTNDQDISLIKHRKVSASTLPNRYTRFHKIDEKLKQIKQTNRAVIQNSKKGSSVDTVKNAINTKQKKLGFPKKIENRKYSSDINYGLESKEKLHEKQSDIQSQYFQRKKKTNSQKNCDSQNKSQADTNKTKSRTQEMKEKEYKEISNLKKDYLKDFISVLEEEEEILPIHNHHHSNTSQNFNFGHNQANQTQQVYQIHQTYQPLLKSNVDSNKANDPYLYNPNHPQTPQTPQISQTSQISHNNTPTHPSTFISLFTSFNPAFTSQFTLPFNNTPCLTVNPSTTSITPPPPPPQVVIQKPVAVSSPSPLPSNPYAKKNSQTWLNSEPNQQQCAAWKKTTSVIVDQNNSSNETELLQALAKQAILNSLRVIDRFKAIIRDV